MERCYTKFQFEGSPGAIKEIANEKIMQIKMTNVK